jgi:hypothetical protein
VKIAGSIALLLLLTAFVMKLALSPLYARYDTDECRRAYASARTRSDTVRVDFHPHAPPSGARNQRCSVVRDAAPATAEMLTGQK